MPGSSTISVGQPLVRPSVLINSIDMFGHSYMDNQSTGGTYGNQLVSDNFMFVNLFANAIGLGRERVRNHAKSGSNLMGANMSRAAGGPARLLSETGYYQSGSTTNVANTSGPGGPIQTAPFARSSLGCAIMCWGINDIGETSVANQTAMVAAVQNEFIAMVSKWRASAVYLAGDTTQWAFGANFSASSVGAGNSSDWSSGKAMQATVVDSAGSSTATFTIPAGYKGEPICFCMAASNANTLVVTWGGTISTTGPYATTGIVGTTTTLAPVGTATNTIVGVRFTAAANGLSSAHAGQTISVKVSTITSATFYLDGVWIESFKPPPVIICNVPRLACQAHTRTFGDGVTTGATTAFTSATANFGSTAPASDVGISIVEVGNQGALPSGLTIGSVTNATTIVLSGNANKAATSIQFALQRVVNGYAVSFYGTNTNFSGATPANHAAADANVASWNAMLATVQGLFGSMVQIADLDSALAQGDQPALLPPNVDTLWDQSNGTPSPTGGYHPNQLGAMYCAQALMKAASALAEESTDYQPLGTLETSAVPTQFDGPVLLPIISGQSYMPDYARLETATTAPATGYPIAITLGTAGVAWAMPMRFITASTLNAISAFVYQVNAPATSGGNVRIGIYDDCNRAGYPQCLINECTSAGAFALGTTAGAKTVGTFSQTTGTAFTAVHYGMLWVVIKVDSLGTTNSILASLTGPNPNMPNSGSLFTAGTGLTVPFGPMAWQVTGLSAGALPGIFPAFSNATLVSTAPAVALSLTLT